MVDDKKDGPSYIATKKIQAVVVPGEPLSTAEMFRRVEATLQTLADGIQSVDVRLGAQSIRLSDLEDHRTRTSTRVRATSENDLSQDVAIARIVNDVAAVKAQLKVAGEERAISAASIQRIEKYATDALNSPKVKAITWALWLALAAWLASRGIKVGT